MSVKLIVTDLDGTLLCKDKNISDYTVDILRRCRERGIKLAFVTARAERATTRFKNLLDPDAIISCNGALVRCGEQIVYSCTIPNDIANEFIKAYSKSANIGYVTVDAECGSFVNLSIDGNKGWRDFEYYAVNDLPNGIDGEAYKFHVEFYDTQAPFEIAAQFPDMSLLGYRGEPWFSYQNKHANKWNAIVKLAEHLHIDPSEIIAFGDDSNDIEMLENCGIGVAMGNAIDEVKAIADQICDTNDNDGVAKWIEAEVLK